MAKCIEGRHHAVGTPEQGLDVGAGQIVAGVQVLDGRFQPVRHLAQAHRTGQPCTALEGVQGAHAGLGRAGVVRPVAPVAQALLQLRQQLVGFFFEDREQLGIDDVDRIDVVVVVEGIGAGAHRRAGLRAHVIQRREGRREQRHRGGRRQGGHFEGVGRRVRVGCRRNVRGGRRRRRRGRGQRQPLVVHQAVHQVRRHRAQEARRELVQQAADLVGRFAEQIGFAQPRRAVGL